MPQPPYKRLIHPDNLVACREIRFQDRRDSQYPHLLRLCSDFELSVLQLQSKGAETTREEGLPQAMEFALATRETPEDFWYSISPGLADLSALDDYAKRYQVDILHLQLIGEDVELEQLNEGLC